MGENEFCSGLEFAVPLTHPRRDAQGAAKYVSWGAEQRSELEIKMTAIEVTFKATSMDELAHFIKYQVFKSQLIHSEISRPRKSSD